MPKLVRLTFVNLYCHEERTLCNSSSLYPESSLMLAMVACRLEVIFINFRLDCKACFSNFLHSSVFRGLSKILTCKHLCIYSNVWDCAIHALRNLRTNFDVLSFQIERVGFQIRMGKRQSDTQINRIFGILRYLHT